MNVFYPLFTHPIWKMKKKEKKKKKNVCISFHRENGHVPTLCPRELSESGQGDEGVGHRMCGVQNAGDVFGLTGLDTANGVRALKPCHSKGEDKHMHPQKKGNTHMASDL